MTRPRAAARCWATEIVFARMAPEHKLRLVAAFQERAKWWP